MALGLAKLSTLLPNPMKLGLLGFHHGLLTLNRLGGFDLGLVQLPQRLRFEIRHGIRMTRPFHCNLVFNCLDAKLRLALHLLCRRKVLLVHNNIGTDLGNFLSNGPSLCDIGIDGLEQQFMTMLGIIATERSGLELVRLLPLGKVETRLRLVQCNHGIFNLILIRPEQTRHANGTFQLGIKSIAILARISRSTLGLEEPTMTEG
mmetsp:Transcript_6805/g.15513  ORF Transcript_6805/g.15513 Transcript_6805/m.15513 type:complete len:204 (+) Transcript_6805:2595-3206(+)